MKHKFLSILMAALVAASPAFAQQSNKGQDEEKEAAEPKTGVRFVNCSPTGVQVPSPLFVKAGKSYAQTRITMRVPSRRVKPANGVINFYDEDPGPAKDKDKAKGGKDKEKPEIKPVMTFQVPENIGSGKSLCIVMPESRENPYKVNSLYIKESSFPKSGVYIINLTDTPLQMKVSNDSNFKDAKIEKIGPFTGGIGEGNTWASPKGGNGTEISFILSAQVKGSKEPRRIKASRFALSDRQSQINVVVKDPKRANSFSLQTIQLMDKPEKGQGDN